MLGVLIGSPILMHCEGDQQETFDEEYPPKANELRHPDRIAPTRDQRCIDDGEEQQHP